MSHVESQYQLRADALQWSALKLILKFNIPHYGYDILNVILISS